MELTILGSGGCAVIPKPLCNCRICNEAKTKGIPYARTGPSLFLHDVNLLVDTPAEIIQQLNRENIERVDYLLFTHLDPDHVEGFRVVEQITLDFRTWRNLKNRKITLILPEELHFRLKEYKSIYGPFIDFYEAQGYVLSTPFRETVQIDQVLITAVPVDRGNQISFIYVFENGNRKVVYAPCDLKPFPRQRTEVQNADLLIIQPGIFESGLQYDFKYPKNHVSRKTLYTFEDTLEIASSIKSRRVLFVHLEEYWNRGYEDYRAVEKKIDHISFAHDGMHIKV